MKRKIIQILVQQLVSKEGRKRLLIIVAFIFFLAFFPIIVIASINPFSALQSNKSASDDPYISAKTNIQNDKKVSVDINILRAIDTVLFPDSKDKDSIKKRADKYLYTEKKIVKKEQQCLHDYINYPGDSNSNLKEDDVKTVQKALNQLGFKVGSVDGIFGDKTKNGVTAYQKFKNINPQNGTVNQETWDALINNKLDKDVTIKDGKCYKMVEKTYIVYIAKSLNEAVAAVKNDVKVSDDQVKTIDEMYQYCLLESEASGDYESGGSGNITVPPITANTQQFIDAIKDGAQKTYKEYGVFSSISLAQGILESGSGSSSLSRKYNNLFGIKADRSWTGQTVSLPTKETYGGVTVTITAAFRVYNNWADSIEDHGKFLKENSTYSEHGVFTANDYVGQANALQAAGYATDPNYAAQLIGIIKEYKLDQYDKQ